MYLPLVGPSMLMLCLAGAEFTLYLQRLTVERRSEEAKRKLDEQQALERQRSFNHIWQDLADSRGSSAVPAWCSDGRRCGTGLPPNRYSTAGSPTTSASSVIMAASPRSMAAARRPVMRRAR